MWWDSMDSCFFSTYCFFFIIIYRFDLQCRSQCNNYVLLPLLVRTNSWYVRVIFLVYWQLYNSTPFYFKDRWYLKSLVAVGDHLYTDSYPSHRDRCSEKSASCIFVLEVSNLPLSPICVLDFGDVPSVWYFSVRFWRCSEYVLFFC